MNMYTTEELLLLKTLIGYFDVIPRGGSWFDSVDYVRTTYHARFDPNNRIVIIGFRIIKSCRN